MTWRIIKSGFPPDCDTLSDAHLDTVYSFDELNGARFESSDDFGNVFFTLVDGRVATLQSIDIETVEPSHDPYLREPHDVDEYVARFNVWWCAAGCLYDSETPAYSCDTLDEVWEWLRSDHADEYREVAGEHSTYRFEVVDTLCADTFIGSFA